MTFAAAKTQAQTEIMKIFNIENVTLGNSETLDISKSGDGNAVLLAISAILQSDKTEAELTELLSTINTDIRTDGTLDSANTKTTLVTAMEYLKSRRSTIRSNIETRYSNLGISATIPAFESYAFKLDTTSPSVSSTSPADSATLVAKDNTTISVTFSEIIDNSTITTNTSNTTCSGTFQVSSDSFSSCIQMSAVPLASNSDSTFSISSTNLVYGSTYKIKVTTDVKDLAGNNLATTYLTSTGFSTARAFSKIAAGAYHSCAIYNDSSLKCWGLNAKGQLGDGTTTNRLTPVSVSNITNPIEIAVGGQTNYASCAIIYGGTIKCWGDNDYGQLGDGTTTQRNTPVSVSSITNASKIFLSKYDHSCALLDNSSVSCWGRNNYGQLGDGTTTDRTTPIIVNNISTATDLALGQSHSCALLSDESVKCWGWNSDGGLGDGSTTNRTSPVSLIGATSVKDIAAVFRSTCVLYKNGTVKCVGQNNFGQLGDGTKTGRTSLVSGTGITNGTKIVGGAGNYCVLLSDSTIKCWGSNERGQLGDGTTTEKLSPVTATGISNAIDISANGSEVPNDGVSCAILSDNSAKCWGVNNYGQVGIGTASTNVTVPTLLQHQ